MGNFSLFDVYPTYIPELEKEVHANFEKYKGATVNALVLLDKLDELRRKHYYDRFQDNDGMLRIACAIIAESIGIKSRADWTSMLVCATESAYRRDMLNPEYENYTAF